MSRRLVISISGASGAGKSQLAKALVARLSDEQSARIPADYFIEPATCPLSDYFRRPLQYDWAELERTLDAPVGTLVSTPAFDFIAFQRSATAEAKSFVIRPIMIVDAMYPYPEADAKVLLETPTTTRGARITERDRSWGTHVVGRWTQLEASREWLEGLQVAYALRLAGDRDLEENVYQIMHLPILAMF